MITCLTDETLAPKEVGQLQSGSPVTGLAYEPQETCSSLEPSGLETEGAQAGWEVRVEDGDTLSSPGVACVYTHHEALEDLIRAQQLTDN